MTNERIACGVLMSAALLLGVTGCPPEPSGDPDAGVGGSAPMGGSPTGARATGGRATGGTGPVAVCQNVTTLPVQKSPCSNEGEAQCDPSGNRCLCMRGIWFCDNECADIPRPSPDTDCSNNPGTLCSYADGAACACLMTGMGPAYRWRCTVDGNSNTCPAAGTITTGYSCTENGLVCDYPDSSTHITCFCTPGADAGTNYWTCLIPGACPLTQPVYPTVCGSGLANCAYGDVHCTCSYGRNWICGWPFLTLFLLGGGGE